MYVRGKIPANGVAIVGSHTPPPAASAFAYELARRLGAPVVAGLALGIDAAAHRGALAAGMPTVAFVGYGFGRTYPREHRELERQIVAAGGAIATLRAPGTRVSNRALVARDCLQAQYARCVVLVCSELDGGAMHTMTFARELDKPRYAVIPPEHPRRARDWAGNARALAEGAAPLPLDVEQSVRILRDLLAR